MTQLFFGVCLIAGFFSITSSTESLRLAPTSPTYISYLEKPQVDGAKLLIRRLRKGKLGAGGLALVARLDERSMSAEPELKEKLELVSAPGLDVQTDYAFNLDAPTYEPSKVQWIYHPKEFEFVLNWTSHYQEVLGGPEGHIRVVVNETFVAYRVSRPVAVKKWLCSYALDRQIDRDKDEELKRLNETIVAPARAKILQEIRTFIDVNTTVRKRK